MKELKAVALKYPENANIIIKITYKNIDIF